ncbi:MAG TPA: phenylalanine--tRNA ligase subunit alpha [Nitriliruptorales bacterium]|nr:phenylalanine--tRNA ligase subunit alpha [Nitriliruptorales bacterium]
MPDRELRPEAVDALRDAALRAVAGAADLDELEHVRVAHTGRRSDLAGMQRRLGSLDPETRREIGARVNAFRDAFDEAFETRRQTLAAAALSERLEGERLDLTMPPQRVPPGRMHLLTQVEHEIVDAFVGLGYRVAEGPEVEDAVFNFDLLNIPADHPARLEMDTVYVDSAEGVVLRTHTSPVQARVMLAERPPIAVVVPGRVYRNDAPDPTHSPVFQQVEGLAVAAGLTMADLRGTLQAFARALFGHEREVRLRPSFFPFTEPSAEVDVSCGFCSGQDPSCRVCSGTGWIEVLGAGMVDPNVLEACGLDPAEVSGFAFGVGIERVAMLRHGVGDIREFYENDARFLERF